ncbi:helix-turn-helix domain-containing protein [Pseudoclavibacter helvolus]|uniref:helix-turn-helix domain-containing protein n=1 Tax=Pseudoclavibacter helvolus TaxID=255205 RepID=UPI000837CF9C|nr:helix-turn-helix domain-containing protein [Pseudoclavibacter helvolus]
MTTTIDSTARTYISVAEAAFEVDCSAGTIRRLILAGRLPAVDIGTGSKARWSIRRDDLVRIDSQRVPAEAA